MFLVCVDDYRLVGGLRDAMQCSTIPCNALQYSAVQYPAVHYSSTAQHRTRQYRTVQYQNHTLLCTTIELMRLQRVVRRRLRRRRAAEPPISGVILLGAVGRHGDVLERA